MTPARNHLVDLLPRPERRRLLALCEPFELVPGTVLCEPGNPTHHVYFPTDGFVSLLGLNHDSPDLEVGIVGREGMLGAAVALGVATARLRLVVQGAGAAWRVGTEVFQRELERNAPLRGCVNRYLYVLMAQMTSAGACHRFHLIGPRMARWMLMIHDRARCDSFQVTQQTLAYRLGVRRVGITNAACVLQRSGLIEYRRGKMTVRNRSGLEAAACGCYAADRQAYAELL